MPIESDWFAVVKHQRIAFRDDARGVTADRAGAGISLPSHGDTVHGCGIGSGNDLAAMAGLVAKPDNAFHFFSCDVGVESDRYGAIGMGAVDPKAYRSAIHRHTVKP